MLSQLSVVFGFTRYFLAEQILVANVAPLSFYKSDYTNWQELQKKP